MCLYVPYVPKASPLRYIKTAKEPITVYKRLQVAKRGDASDRRGMAPYRGKQYTIGKTYSFKKALVLIKRESGGNKDRPRHRVEHGYHAHTSLKEAKAHLGWCQDVFICTIPRGAKYVLGTSGDIVSTSLKIGERWFVS